MVGAWAGVAAGTMPVLGDVRRRVGEMSVFALMVAILFGAADGVGIDGDSEGFGDRKATDHGGGHGGGVLNFDF